MRILLAIDGSPCSYSAVGEVARRLWPKDTEIRVIAVEPPSDPSLLRSTPPTALDEWLKARRAETVQHLQNAVAVLSQNLPDCRITSSLLDGIPKDVIVATAGEWGADLIVVGSHGYGSVRRFFLGSVSLYVVSNAPCSVEVVRGPAPLSVEMPAAS